ncbi:esterase [Paraliobacillus quinghaiensis]|uniref:Esterase n=1 Tax=Paraliobacillus quinghaiensis TaxID=470815 RepID=A0A917TTE8_9BACI|nr:hotdog fold thioesterase [Paraliobacillus quinghaiensis]GGM37036.1 esterase [Paraliobacillus quinghaiensis]
MDLRGTLMEALEMEVIKQQAGIVEIKMPVNEKTRQPMGYLHGGASVALAESAASIGALTNVDASKYQIFGIEINANHIKSKRAGWVIARATPVHLGRKTMVWQINIVDESEELIATSRCTIGVVEL